MSDFTLNVKVKKKEILYFIEYIFTLKMMLKYSLHYTWKVAEKGFKMAFIMNKLAMIKSCEIILEK